MVRWTVDAATRVAGQLVRERFRQVNSEGYTPEHDDDHGDGEIAKAAACFAIGKPVVTSLGGHSVCLWPWDSLHWKPYDRRSNLVRAGALIIAEIERIDRLESRQQGEGKS